MKTYRFLNIFVVALTVMACVAFFTASASAEWFELRGGLPNSAKKFTETGRGTVAFVGGSITEMNGWRNLVIEELQKRFPDTEFEFISAGISSTGSTPGSFRLTTDVFMEGKTIDLLFEEAAVNDYTNFRTPTEMLRGMEGIIRHAKLMNPKIDVILMHFAEPDKCRDYRAGKTPEVIEIHEKVAEHYNIPSINLAKEVTDRIDAGEFTWENDFRDLHPAPFGHKLYHATICRLFDVAWNENAPKMETVALPEPLDEFSYYNGHYESISGAELGAGWNYVEDWKPAIQCGTRQRFVNVPMLECTEPGKELTFRFRGRGIGIFSISGPDTGIVEWSVDGSPWKSKDFYTPWSNWLFLPWAQVFEAELADTEHVLKLRLSPEKNAKSTGTAIRIVHFLVN